MNRVRSLREYVEQLKLLGEIVEIETEIDWNLELGASRGGVTNCGPGPAVQQHQGHRARLSRARRRRPD